MTGFSPVAPCQVGLFRRCGCNGRGPSGPVCWSSIHAVTQFFKVERLPMTLDSE